MSPLALALSIFGVMLALMVVRVPIGGFLPYKGTEGL